MLSRNMEWCGGWERGGGRNIERTHKYEKAVQWPDDYEKNIEPGQTRTVQNISTGIEISICEWKRITKPGLTLSFHWPAVASLLERQKVKDNPFHGKLGVGAIVSG